MYLTLNDILATDRIRRLNIINSIAGIKPANLVGSLSDDGTLNLAIFSSVVHIGSNPPLLGFIARPAADTPRHTLSNIRRLGCYTINAIPQTLIERSHYTSAKFGSGVSEFERCNIKPGFLPGFAAPFVAESPIKIGMKFMQEIPIELNGTSLVIGMVEHLIIRDELVDARGYIDFEAGNMAGIGGLNRYYSVSQIGEFPYARPEETPDFTTSDGKG